MKLQDFIKQGKVRRGEPDKALARSLLETAINDIGFLNKIKITEESSRRLMCDYYDCLRMVIEAMAALDGIKSYSHEAFTFYLKEKKEETLAEKFDRYRKIRNQLAYYGRTISSADSKNNIEDIKSVFKSLKEKYLRGEK